MKALIILLSLYIFVLSCIPCTDSYDGKNIIVVKAVTSQEHTHNDTEHTDLCSPLCICSCCSGVILGLPSFSALFEAVPTHYEQLVQGFYLQHAPSRFLTAIWQPPKA